MSDRLTFLWFVGTCNLGHLATGPQEALWNTVNTYLFSLSITFLLTFHLYYCTMFFYNSFLGSSFFSGPSVLFMFIRRLHISLILFQNFCLSTRSLYHLCMDFVNTCNLISIKKGQSGKNQIFLGRSISFRDFLT
jgi:hypothetical protein